MAGVRNAPYVRSFIAYPSAARTTHTATAPFFCQGEQGCRLDIDITAFSGTSITFTWQYWEQTSGAWLTLLATSAQSGTGHVVLQVDPRIATSANAALNAILPQQMRILPSGTITSVTYGVAVTFAP